jgi:hypothetical protein
MNKRSCVLVNERGDAIHHRTLLTVDVAVRRSAFLSFPNPRPSITIDSLLYMCEASQRLS